MIPAYCGSSWVRIILVNLLYKVSQGSLHKLLRWAKIIEYIVTVPWSDFSFHLSLSPSQSANHFTKWYAWGSDIQMLKVCWTELRRPEYMGKDKLAAPLIHLLWSATKKSSRNNKTIDFIPLMTWQSEFVKIIK